MSLYPPPPLPSQFTLTLATGRWRPPEQSQKQLSPKRGGMRAATALLLLALAGEWLCAPCKQGWPAPEQQLPPAVGARAAAVAGAPTRSPPPRPPAPGAQLAHAGKFRVTSEDEAGLVEEVAAAAAIATGAEPAVPIGPAAPTYTPYVPTKAEVICLDGLAPAIKLTPANCVARYTPVYDAVL